MAGLFILAFGIQIKFTVLLSTYKNKKCTFITKCIFLIVKHPSTYRVRLMGEYRSHWMTYQFAIYRFGIQI